MINGPMNCLGYMYRSGVNLMDKVHDCISKADGMLLLICTCIIQVRKCNKSLITSIAFQHDKSEFEYHIYAE